MTVLFRCRVEEKALAKADKVTESLGTKTPEVVRMFIHQIGETGVIPVSLSANQDGLLDKQRRNQVLKDLDDSEGW